MQTETIYFSRTENRSADERRIVRRSSADDLLLICRRAAARPQTVTLMTSFVGATTGDLQVAQILPCF
jgi:plasmid replication initiation protein